MRQIIIKYISNNAVIISRHNENSCSCDMCSQANVEKHNNWLEPLSVFLLWVSSSRFHTFVDRVSMKI